MMKIIKSNKTNRNILITLGAILLIGTAGVATAYYFKIGPFTASVDDSINLDNASQDEIKTGTDAKQQSVESDNNKSQTGSDPSPEPQTIENSNKKSVHAEITATNQDESILHVRTLIQTVANSGTCNLTMTGPQHKTYAAIVDIQALPSSSTCKGFDIPLEKLSSGIWTIKIDFNNSELTASTSKEVTIQ